MTSQPSLAQSAVNNSISSDLPVRVFHSRSGIEEKAKITVRFLKQRMQDYEQIKREIVELEAEVNGSTVKSKTREQGYEPSF